MTIKQALELMNCGSELTVSRSPSSRVGNIVLSVKVKYTVGKEPITDNQFQTIRKKNKLVKDYDKSSSSRCVYKLSRI